MQAHNDFKGIPGPNVRGVLTMYYKEYLNVVSLHVEMW